MELIYWVGGALVALLGVVFTAFRRGKSSGRKSAERKQTKHEQETAREARKVEEDSRTLSDDDFIERMRERNKR